MGFMLQINFHIENRFTKEVGNCPTIGCRTHKIMSVCITNMLTMGCVWHFVLALVGFNCDEDLDECDPASSRPPCLNGATCVNFLGKRPRYTSICSVQSVDWATQSADWTAIVQSAEWTSHLWIVGATPYSCHIYSANGTSR